MRRWLADAVTLSRLLLLIPWVYLQTAGSRWALPLFAVIALTDLIDGPIARRLSTVRPRGQLLDAACDAVVVLGAAIVLGLRDPRFLFLAGLVILCFATWRICGAVLGCSAYTRLGRYNGTACYLLLLIASAASWLPTAGRRAHEAVEWGVIGVTAFLLGASSLENTVRLIRASHNRSGGAHKAP